MSALGKFARASYRFAIYDAADPSAKIGEVEAADEIDALSEFAITQGYADPRTLEDGPDYFTEWFDGTKGMIFENTELVAVKL